MFINNDYYYFGYVVEKWFCFLLGGASASVAWFLVGRWQRRRTTRHWKDAFRSGGNLSVESTAVSASATALPSSMQTLAVNAIPSHPLKHAQDTGVDVKNGSEVGGDVLDLEREQLTRNYSFFGEKPMERIRGAFVVVVGLGGVGSHAAIHLLRSGRTILHIILSICMHSCLT